MIRNFFKRFDLFFEARSQNGILWICLALSLLIGFADYRGNSGVLIIYLIPIFLAAWYGNQRVGLVIAIYCSLAWFIQVTYVSASGDLSWMQLVSLAARLATFAFMVQVISRLRSAMRLQKQLTEFIVHDLRSPISSAITGLLTLKDSGKEFDEIDQEMIDLSLVSNQRALELVNSILDVSKLEAGSMTIEPQDVELEIFLLSCVEPVELWAKGSELKIDSQSAIAMARFDPDLTRRVVVNLLSNAIKYSPVGSTIHIDVAPSGEQNLHLTVTDVGPGIPPEYVSSIFEPFSQVKGTKGGTGLGLAFCRLAINAQHGRIWAESKLGQGTTFHVVLPRNIAVAF